MSLTLSGTRAATENFQNKAQCPVNGNSGMPGRAGTPDCPHPTCIRPATSEKAFNVEDEDCDRHLSDADGNAPGETRPAVTAGGQLPAASAAPGQLESSAYPVPSLSLCSQLPCITAFVRNTTQRYSNFFVVQVLKCAKMTEQSHSHHKHST